MGYVAQVNVHPDPVLETGTRTEVSDLVCRAGSPGFGWLRTYCRTVGCIQWLYASFFGLWRCQGL